ncbi:MAG: NUDIX hydrolase [candidate division Zixibacteria bacterium]|nr:NUDIX hydrolase [candidate division Zixibacteria bacterium]
MSYLRADDIASMEDKYGRPAEFETEIEMTPNELDVVRRSQKNGRAHDLTMFIFKGNQFLFIAKHFYPPDLFRAPSGAANPGESIIDGARREAYEETGVDIELERYLARIRVKFINSHDTRESIDWTSHVFKARYIAGDVYPKDTREIREARFVGFDEIPRFNEIMLKVGIGGFQYRVFLTEKTMKLLQRDILEANEIESQKS